MFVSNLPRISRRLATKASLLQNMDAGHVRNIIAKRLGGYGLGRLPVFAGHLVIFLLSRPPAWAARTIDFVLLVLLRFNLFDKDLVTLKVDATFMASGRTEEAIKYCRDFLDQHPDAYLAALVLVDLYLATDRIRDALAIIRGLSHNCESADGLYGAGRRIMGLASVNHIVERTVISGVQAAVQKLNRGLQDEESYLSTAKRCLDGAIARSAQSEVHHMARYWRGVLHLQQGEDGLAEQDFRSVVDARRRYVFAYAFLADIYARRGEVQRAIDLLQRVPREFVASLPIFERLVRLRLAIGDVRGALETVGRPPSQLVGHVVADVR